MVSHNTLRLFPCLVTQSWLKIICFLNLWCELLQNLVKLEFCNSFSISNWYSECSSFLYEYPSLFQKLGCYFCLISCGWLWRVKEAGELWTETLVWKLGKITFCLVLRHRNDCCSLWREVHLFWPWSWWNLVECFPTLLQDWNSDYIEATYRSPMDCGDGYA